MSFFSLGKKREIKRESSNALSITPDFLRNCAFTGRVFYCFNNELTLYALKNLSQVFMQINAADKLALASLFTEVKICSHKSKREILGASGNFLRHKV